ncbi:MAG: hypothetical protein ACPL7I_08015, partial [Myxococcota bacterium]
MPDNGGDIMVSERDTEGIIEDIIDHIGDINNEIEDVTIEVEDITDARLADDVIGDRTENELCNNSCECVDGEVCFNGRCERWEDVSIFNPIFCCTGKICPQNSVCEYGDGRRGRCMGGSLDGGEETGDITGEDIEIEDSYIDIRDAGADIGDITDIESSDCVGGIVTQYFWDCTSCPDGRELSPIGRTYRINRWRYDGKNYLIFSNYTSANIYDVTNPENPVLAMECAPYTPWGLIEGSPDDDTEQWDLALLPDNPTGLAMFMNFGWVTFSVTTGAQGQLTGFSQPLQRFRITPPFYIPTSRGARNAALFVAGN